MAVVLVQPVSGDGCDCLFVGVYDVYPNMSYVRVTLPRVVSEAVDLSGDIVFVASLVCLINYIARYPLY